MTKHRENVARFKARVERFLKRHKMAPSTFGRLSCNRSKLVSDLRRGLEPTPATMDALEQWMADYKADDDERRAA